MNPILSPSDLSGFDPIGIGFTLLKILYLVAFGLYIAFSVVVLSQIKQMTAALNGQLDLPLKLLGWIHFAIAIIAFILALVIL